MCIRDSDPSAQLFDAMGKWKPGAIGWANSPSQQIELDELQTIVSDCLKSLPKSQADVFVLSVMEEMGSDEICRELGITPSNMWVRMHRARLGLASCVSSKWKLEEAQHNVG